eukprot:COSAG02_NODE_4583_length_5190_cov_4.804753_5_plen_67_part_00
MSIIISQQMYTTGRAAMCCTFYVLRVSEIYWLRARSECSVVIRIVIIYYTCMGTRPGGYTRYRGTC